MTHVMRTVASVTTEGVISDFGHWIVDQNPTAAIVIVRAFRDESDIRAGPRRFDGYCGGAGADFFTMRTAQVSAFEPGAKVGL